MIFAILICSIFALFWFNETFKSLMVVLNFYKLRKNGVLSKGTVTQVFREEYDDSISYNVHFRFLTNDKKNTYCSLDKLKEYQVGTKISVLYLPEDKNICVIDDDNCLKHIRNEVFKLIVLIAWCVALIKAITMMINR
jgi:hypothetical protein